MANRDDKSKIVQKSFNVFGTQQYTYDQFCSWDEYASLGDEITVQVAVGHISLNSITEIKLCKYILDHHIKHKTTHVTYTYGEGGAKIAPSTLAHFGCVVALCNQK